MQWTRRPGNDSARARVWRLVRDHMGTHDTRPTYDAGPHRSSRRSRSSKAKRNGRRLSNRVRRSHPIFVHVFVPVPIVGATLRASTACDGGSCTTVSPRVQVCSSVRFRRRAPPERGGTAHASVANSSAITGLMFGRARPCPHTSIVDRGMTYGLDDLQDHRTFFESLYSDTYEFVSKYCRQRAPTPEDAEDALSATYLVAWRRIHEAAGINNHLAWLYGVARRVLANQRRSAMRHRRLQQRIFDRSVRTGTSIPTQVEAAVQLEAIERAVESLRALDKLILRLAAYEGLSYQSIAEQTGLTKSAVRSRLHRARKTLFRKLGP